MTDPTSPAVSLSRPDVAEHDLPGIGRRYDMAVDQDRVTVVIHHSGRRDLYVFAGADDDPVVVSMGDSQARTLGAILGGAYFKPAAVQEIEAVIGSILIDWVTLRPGSPGVGRSIADLEIRGRTRMTVAAVLRDGNAMIAPEPDQELAAGDQLVVIGRREDLAGFVDLVVGAGHG